MTDPRVQEITTIFKFDDGSIDVTYSDLSNRENFQQQTVGKVQALNFVAHSLGYGPEFVLTSVEQVSPPGPPMSPCPVEGCDKPAR